MKYKLSNLPKLVSTNPNLIIFIKEKDPPQFFIRKTLNQAASELQPDFSIKVEACMASVDEL